MSTYSYMISGTSMASRMSRTDEQDEQDRYDLDIFVASLSWRQASCVPCLYGLKDYKNCSTQVERTCGYSNNMLNLY